MTAFVAFSSNQNRDSSSALLEVNSTYGPGYNPPTFTNKMCSGSDSEGPLWSWADSGVSYTDDGYTGEWTHGGSDKNILPTFSEDTRAWIIVGQRWTIKELIKKFAVSAYAYVSCSSDNHNYETKYNLRAEVPAGFQYPNVRNPDTQTEEGAFSDYEDRSGSKNGWGHEISTNPNASASANGTNLTSGEKHSTSAATPTPSTARDFDIYCGLCSDQGCDVCNDHR
ncbi:MAG: hypothetical protein OXI67_08765 [Candidatus Poribacteria bacterium]|nr:hypothetical protein [Candidatus Poribacteria bacterium]